MCSLCPCRGPVLDTVTPRAGRCLVLLCCFRARLLALSLTSQSLRCPGWVNSPSTHRMSPLDLSEGHSHPQWNYSVLFSLPSRHLISLKERRNTQQVTDLSSLSELTQHRQFCTIIQSTHRRQTDQLWMSITSCSTLWQEKCQAWAAILCYPFLPLFSLTLPVMEFISFPRNWNCQSIIPTASSKELHPIFKLQSCKMKKKV